MADVCLQSLFFRRCLMAHKRKKQSTGSWAGNRDRHEKAPHNSAKKSDGWIDMCKRTNSQRNKNRSKGIIETIFGF